MIMLMMMLMQMMMLRLMLICDADGEGDGDAEAKADADADADADTAPPMPMLMLMLMRTTMAMMALFFSFLHIISPAGGLKYLLALVLFLGGVCRRFGADAAVAGADAGTCGSMVSVGFTRSPSYVSSSSPSFTGCD